MRHRKEANVTRYILRFRADGTITVEHWRRGKAVQAVPGFRNEAQALDFLRELRASLGYPDCLKT